MKLVIIYYTVTEQKPSVRMDTYIDFTDFFDSYIYFFHIIGKISRFRQSHPCQILRISSCHFPLNNLCKIIAHTKSSSYDQNTRKRLQGVQNINTHKLLVKQIQTDTTDQNKSFQIKMQLRFLFKILATNNIKFFTKYSFVPLLPKLHVSNCIILTLISMS